MEADKSVILAQPPIGSSGLMCREYHLELEAKDGTIMVKECNEKRHLPAACPCRHLNYNGTFCLGLKMRPGVNIKNSIWWEYLGIFLQFQEVAEKTKIWPQYVDENGKIYNDLSHGKAANHQLKAEKIASELGIRDCYDDAMLDRKNVLSNLPVNSEKNEYSKRPFKNGRSPCPSGCKKKGKPILRRNCNRKYLWAKFFEEETDRQLEAKKFADTFGDAKCNLDMEHCEFKKKMKSYP